MLDFLWWWTGSQSPTVPYPVQVTVPASGQVQITWDQAVTGTTGLFITVNGIARATTLVSGSGTNQWYLQPATGIYAGELVELGYTAGDLVGSTGSLPVVNIPVTPIATVGTTPGVNASVLVAPIGTYPSGLVQQTDGTLFLASAIGPAVTFVLHLLLWKPFGAGNHVPYQQAMIQIIANKVYTRFQVPTRGTVRMFVRSLNTLGQHVDCPEKILDWRDIVTYNVYEQHSPERAVVGEKLMHHALGYTMELGTPDASSITSVNRLFDQTTPQLGVYVQTGYHHVSTNTSTTSDEGTRSVGPLFKEV